MTSIMQAREESHIARQAGHTVFITPDGTSFTPPPAKQPLKLQISRGLIGGLRDMGQGAIDLRNELAEILAPYSNVLPPEAKDAIITSFMGFTAPRTEDGSKTIPDLPEVSAENASGAENLLRGLVQFGAGAAAAPIRGAGMAAQMGRGAVADALFDPEDGNLSTVLKEFGLENAVLDFLDSKVGEEAAAEERLQARVKQSLEGAGLGALVDGAIAGFRAIRSDKGLVETVRQSLANTGIKAKAAFDAIPVPDGTTLYSNPLGNLLFGKRTDNGIVYRNPPEFTSDIVDSIASELNKINGIDASTSVSNVSASSYVNVDFGTVDQDGDLDEFFGEYKLRISDHADRYGSDKTLRIDELTNNIFDEEFGDEFIETRVSEEDFSQLVKQGVESVLDAAKQQAESTDVKLNKNELDEFLSALAGQKGDET